MHFQLGFPARQNRPVNIRSVGIARAQTLDRDVIRPESAQKVIGKIVRHKGSLNQCLHGVGDFGSLHILCLKLFNADS